MSCPHRPPGERKPSCMATTLNAFVPAAGLGERLRPITDHVPKPLLPVLGRPLLAATLKRVAALPVNRVGINLHHKADAVAAWVEDAELAHPTRLVRDLGDIEAGGLPCRMQGVERRRRAGRPRRGHGHRRVGWRDAVRCHRDTRPRTFVIGLDVEAGPGPEPS